MHLVLDFLTIMYICQWIHKKDGLFFQKTGTLPQTKLENSYGAKIQTEQFSSLMSQSTFQAIMTTFFLLNMHFFVHTGRFWRLNLTYVEVDAAAAAAAVAQQPFCGGTEAQRLESRAILKHLGSTGMRRLLFQVTLSCSSVLGFFWIETSLSYSL